MRPHKGILHREHDDVLFGSYTGVPLFSLKVIGSDGLGSMSQVLAAIDWVTRNARNLNIRVVNLSIQGEKSQACCDAIAAATATGLSFVVAAGEGQHVILLSAATYAGLFTMLYRDACANGGADSCFAHCCIDPFCVDGVVHASATRQ